MATDQRCAQIGGYYLGNRHELIHRHSESVMLNADQTARWGLKIDFELPIDRAAQCARHGGESMFLFPLVFLGKSAARTGFYAEDESGNAIPMPNRSTCDKVSAIAATRAAGRLREESERSTRPPGIPGEHLSRVLEYVTAGRPYEASVILNELFHGLDSDVIDLWKEQGLADDLEMLVEHSLVWVPLRGLAGERRTIQVGNDIELRRQPFLRWNFGELKEPRIPFLQPFLASRLANSRQVLDTGEAKYGRRARRVSFSVLGERLIQPLAWMPIEFDFPTIYTRRCDSYHFELTCPRGLSPRGVKMALDSAGEEPGEVPGRTTVGTRAAHVYLPGGRSIGDVMFRATVGIGGAAFPILWLLMGAITSIVLWGLAATDPTYLFQGHGDADTRNEVAAGVLLVVPALLGAIVVGSDDGPVASVLSGSRILLLTTGLCAAAAAAVFVDVDPISNHPRAVWTACAAVATAATIPLATSWLISLPAVWRRLRALNSVALQYIALSGLVSMASATVIVMSDAEGDGVLRGALAVGLLLLSVLLILLASNRLPVALVTNRLFLPVAALAAATACVALGCIELRAAIDPGAKLHSEMEGKLLWVLLLSPLTGLLVWLSTLVFRRRHDQISVSPVVGKALLDGERIRELRHLREMRSGQDRRRVWRIPNPVGRILRDSG